MASLLPITALPATAAIFLLLFARVGAVLMLLPVFSDDAVPGRIRLMIALGMTLGLYGLLSPYVAPFAGRTDALAGILVIELVTGLALGMLVRIVFLAMATAGAIISLQVGLTSSLVSDPMQGGQTTTLAKLVSVGAAVVCMAMAVHHLWIEAIVHSYATFPVGGVPSAGDFAAAAVAVAGRSLTMAVGLAAPMIVYGIVFNVALALAARLAPAIQIFFVAQPLNLALGLALFATMAGAMTTAFATSFAAWLRTGLG